jgi:tRNA (cmo5U34)-methyltransferase
MKVPSKRFAIIKEHFEKEAAVFDKLFFKVVPRYNEMIQTVVEAAPFHRKDRLKIIDLGCGTGNLAQKIVTAYPNAQITCIDMAENMLKMAKTKLGKQRNISFWLGDIRDFDYSGKYDMILSSLVLHHIEKKDKPKFYRKLFNALRDGGVFYTIDIFLSPSSHLQKIYMDKWKIFMKTNGLPMKKINEMIARHQREDRPVVFEDELSIVRKAGFKCVDVVLKHYNFAVYGGQKQAKLR